MVRLGGLVCDQKLNEVANHGQYVQEYGVLVEVAPKSRIITWVDSILVAKSSSALSIEHIFAIRTEVDRPMPCL